MQPKANKSGFRSDTNRPWRMHDKIMNVSEHKFIFLLVSLTENSPVTSLPCHQFRWYFSGMWWADWILPSSSIKGIVQRQQQKENSVIIYSPLYRSKCVQRSCFPGAQKVTFIYEYMPALFLLKYGIEYCHMAKDLKCKLYWVLLWR